MRHEDERRRHDDDKKPSSEDISSSTITQSWNSVVDGEQLNVNLIHEISRSNPWRKSEISNIYSLFISDIFFEYQSPKISPSSKKFIVFYLGTFGS